LGCLGENGGSLCRQIAPDLGWAAVRMALGAVTWEGESGEEGLIDGLLCRKGWHLFREGTCAEDLDILFRGCHNKDATRLTMVQAKCNLYKS
jgi:hypothetical protein